MICRLGGNVGLIFYGGGFTTDRAGRVNGERIENRQGASRFVCSAKTVWYSLTTEHGCVNKRRNISNLAAYGTADSRT